MTTLVWIIVAVIAIAIIWLIAVYNGLITLKNRTQEAWSDIEVQLKRRYDLIPNLIKVVKGYAKHEKEVFEKVTETRTAAIKAQGTAEKQKAENMLTEALKTVFAVAENYPQLRASENFLELQRELTDTEDKIEAARRFYNGNVRDLNIKIQVFPNNLMARSLGFKEFELFEIEATQAAAAKEPVEVKLD